MPSNLAFSVRFLQPRSHGRGDSGEPEWPPSPLRFLQALAAAAAALWNERERLNHAVPALRWLESLPPPVIAAGTGITSEVPAQFYVPDNTMDLLVPKWKKGHVSEAPSRTEKVVQPVHLIGDALHYLYAMPDGKPQHLKVLRDAARSITHLGWGIDMVAANADFISHEDAEKLPGHRWRPVERGGVSLRVPISGTLDDLIRKHQDFLNRVSPDGFRPVPPLRDFRVVQYNSDTAPDAVLAGRPYAAFRLITPDGERTASFSLQSGSRDLAGMLRNLIGDAADRLNFTPEDVRTLIHGHDVDGSPLRGEASERRLMFLSLPTLNPALNRVERIRRVLVVGPLGEGRIRKIQQFLGGELLCHDNAPRAILDPLYSADWVLKQYVGESTVWSTVVPAVFPGHHKGDLDFGNELVRRMFNHAGLPEPLEVEWRSVGFRPGTDLANRYIRPSKMNGSMYHIRVRFARSVRGPIAIGAGRFRGFGLMACEGST